MDRLCSSLQARGFDLLQPFNSVWYNSNAKPLPTLIDLPVGCDGKGLPALLVGNTKSMWPHFMEHLRKQADIGTDPLDSFVRANVFEALADAKIAPGAVEVYHSYETTPDRLIAFQRLADVCGLSFLEESIHLCMHPTYGPWFALRSIVVFKDASAAEMLTPSVPPARAFVTIDPIEREAGAAMLARAVEAKKNKDPESWKLWMQIRDSFSNGKDHRYSDDQLQYHYTKNKTILKTAI